MCCVLPHHPCAPSCCGSPQRQRQCGGLRPGLWPRWLLASQTADQVRCLCCGTPCNCSSRCCWPLPRATWGGKAVAAPGCTRREHTAPPTLYHWPRQGPVKRCVQLPAYTCDTPACSLAHTHACGHAAMRASTSHATLGRCQPPRPPPAAPPPTHTHGGHSRSCTRARAQDFPSTALTFEAWVSTSDFCHAGEATRAVVRSLALLPRPAPRRTPLRHVPARPPPPPPPLALPC